VERKKLTLFALGTPRQQCWQQRVPPTARRQSCRGVQARQLIAHQRGQHRPPSSSSLYFPCSHRHPLRTIWLQEFVTQWHLMTMARALQVCCSCFVVV